ncbi:MAG: ATP-binding protein [Bacilli bacterium]
MKQNKTKSLHFKVWFYLIIFSLSVIIFLWVCQILSLDLFYQYSKSKELDTIAYKIDLHYKDDNFYAYLDNISQYTDACIQIYTKEENIYASSQSNIQCFIDSKDNSSIDYKNDFITSNLKKKRYTITNRNNNKKTIIYARKIDNGVYLFVNMSLTPLNTTKETLKKQLRFLAFIVLILSFIIAYVISKLLSKPIEDINNFAKELGQGNYKAKLENNSDITEIQELTETLNYTKDALSKTDSVRKELMANVSHDLKTPLTMIKAYAEMARDLNKDNIEKREDNLNIIIEETDRLNLLVNDILDLTKMEDSKEKLNYEKVDLDKLIRTIIKRYDLYKEKGYTIIYKGSKKAYVNIDVKRIEQVLYNLINNAINYTGEDKTVTIKLINNLNNYIVEVIDTGKGIDKEELNLIWDKYYKSDKTHSRLFLGTGIGLSIVRSILVKHNFKYGVNSIKNKGTTFYFEIKK